MENSKKYQKLLFQYRFEIHIEMKFLFQQILYSNQTDAYRYFD